MIKKSFKVKWQMKNPVVPTHDFIWKQTKFPQHEIDLLNDWPEGTFEATCSGLNENLARNQNWTFNTSAALTKASQIFKRGVASRDNQPMNQSGQYSIELIDGVSQIENIVSKYDAILLDYNFFINWKHIFQSSSSHIGIYDVTEATKDLHTLAKMKRFILTSKAKYIGIFAGGIVSDIAAFAATEVGAVFDLIPTSSLAMVDACIGGKCGVNVFPYGKNLVGRFSFPGHVYIYKRFLDTLKPRVFRAGIFEALKHCHLSGNKELFSSLIKGIDSNMINDNDLLEVIKVKSDIVEIDANEASVRSTLNWGHTFAHALEAYAHKKNIDIMHGEAVLIGIIFATNLSKIVLKFESFDEEQRLIDILKSRYFLQIRKHLLEINIEDIYPSIVNDKKNDNSNSDTKWILLSDWGQVSKSENSFLTAVKRESIVICLEKLKQTLRE